MVSNGLQKNYVVKAITFEVKCSQQIPCPGPKEHGNEYETPDDANKFS